MVSKTFLIIALFAFFSVQVESFNTKAFALRQARGLEDDIKTLLDEIKATKDQKFTKAITEVNSRNSKLKTDAASVVAQTKTQINSRINEFVIKINELVNIGVPTKCTKGKVDEIRATGTVPSRNMEQCSREKQEATWQPVSDGVQGIVKAAEIVDQLYKRLKACGKDISCLTNLLLESYQVKDSLPRDIEQRTAAIARIIDGALSKIKVCGVTQQSEVARLCVGIYNNAITCANGKQ